MSKKTLIITLMGPDRPGLVAEISQWVTENGGNWLESRLLNLGDQFAGALRIEIEPSAEGLLIEKLRSLESKGLTINWVEDKSTSPKATRRITQLTLSGQDQPGVVHRVFSILGRYKINVEELKTGTRGAPWSGHVLFEAEARLAVPADTDIANVRRDLEALSHDLLVEIEIGG